VFGSFHIVIKTWLWKESLCNSTNIRKTNNHISCQIIEY